MKQAGSLSRLQVHICNVNLSTPPRADQSCFMPSSTAGVCVKKEKGMAIWHGYATYSNPPSTPFSKQTQLAFGLYFTVIDAYFIREFTVFL